MLDIMRHNHRASLGVSYMKSVHKYMFFQTEQSWFFFIFSRALSKNIFASSLWLTVTNKSGHPPYHKKRLQFCNKR